MWACSCLCASAEPLQQQRPSPSVARRAASVAPPAAAHRTTAKVRHGRRVARPAPATSSAPGTARELIPRRERHAGTAQAPCAQGRKSRRGIAGPRPSELPSAHDALSRTAGARASGVQCQDGHVCGPPAACRRIRLPLPARRSCGHGSILERGVEVVEEGMRHGLLGRNARGGLVSEHVLQQVEPHVVEARADLG